MLDYVHIVNFLPIIIKNCLYSCFKIDISDRQEGLTVSCTGVDPLVCLSVSDNCKRIWRCPILVLILRFVCQSDNCKRVRRCPVLVLILWFVCQSVTTARGFDGVLYWCWSFGLFVSQWQLQEGLTVSCTGFDPLVCLSVSDNCSLAN